MEIKYKTRINNGSSILKEKARIRDLEKMFGISINVNKKKYNSGDNAVIPHRKMKFGSKAEYMITAEDTTKLNNFLAYCNLPIPSDYSLLKN